MLAFAYLIPFFACLILNVGFHYGGPWTAYLWIIVAGEALVACMHRGFSYWRTHSVEYLGSLVKDINYEAPWTEIQHYTVTRRDSRGNTYTTVQTRYVYHPELYYFHTTRGSRIGTDAAFYREVTGRWGVRPRTVSWSGARIKGGVRYGEEAVMPPEAEGLAPDDTRRVSVTEKHRYSNRIKNSNSIFRFLKIDRKKASEMGLYEYPKISRHDAPCILSADLPVDFAVREKFRRFNGYHAPKAQMRLYMLVFRAEQGVGIAEFQRAYWHGGNKNELVVCLGMTPDSKVKWARAFSWADNQQLEVDAADWLMRHPDMDWDAFYEWFAGRFHTWERKRFADFRYISVSLPLWQVLTVYILSVLENVVAIRLALGA